MSLLKTMPVSYIQLIIRALGNEGICSSQLLNGTDLTMQSLNDGQLTSINEFIRVILNTKTASNDPAIGLRLGLLLHPSTHGSVGWAATSSPTLSGAINIFQQYSRIRTPFVLYNAFTTKKHYIIRVTLTKNLKAAHTIFVEAMLMLLQHIIEFILGRPMDDAHIHINSSAPCYASSYKDYFHCPVHFDSDFLDIRLPISLKDTINPSADANLYQLALEQCQEATALSQKDIDLPVSTYNYLSAHLGQNLTLKSSAEHFNLSTRTFNRRLKHRNTCFKAIKEDMHTFQACSYLRRSTISVDALAMIFGYSDPANFRRSFKRWTGKTPQQYRQEQQKELAELKQQI